MTTTDPAVRVPVAASMGALFASVVDNATLRDNQPGAWRRMAAAARGFVVFQTEDFVAGWAHAFLGDRDDLRFVLVHRGDTLVGLIPVEVHTRGVVTTARLAGAPVGQYDDVLIDPAVDAAGVIDAACAALRGACGVDVVLLTRVRSDSALRQGCHDFIALGAAENAPYADLGDQGGEAFLATLKSRVRRQLAKRRRQLAGLGPCEFAQASTVDEADAWMREAIALKREWLRGSGRLSHAFADPRTARFLVAGARESAGGPSEATDPGRTRIVVSRLAVGGKTAALEAGFIFRDTYHFYLGAFAPEFAKFGPGNVLTESVMRACADGGIRRYDMLAPDSRNKREWANGSVSVADLALPLTALGRLDALIVHQRLRPTARQMFYMLPDRVRSMIADRVLAA